MRLCRLFPRSRMTGLVTNRWMGSRTWKKRERERAEERKRPSESFSVAWMTAAMIHFLTCSCCFSHTLTNAPFPLSVQISHNGTSTLSFLLYFLLSTPLLFSQPSVLFVENLVFCLDAQTPFLSFNWKFLILRHQTWRMK